LKLIQTGICPSLRIDREDDLGGMLWTVGWMRAEITRSAMDSNVWRGAGHAISPATVEYGRQIIL